MRATVKEKPILFASEMVKAIIDDRKTQTRRIAKLNETLFRDEYPELKKTAIEAALKISPYQVGDRLWVREAWGYFGGDEYLYQREPSAVMYRASWGTDRRSLTYTPKWRPSIHMPRWASRLTLEVTAVRVERLQEITHRDALAEGVEEGGAPRPRFRALWDKINGKRAPWASNCFVWVIEFRRLSA